VDWRERFQIRYWGRGSRSLRRRQKQEGMTSLVSCRQNGDHEAPCLAVS
jgi:hypothetical protein